MEEYARLESEQQYFKHVKHPILSIIVFFFYMAVYEFPPQSDVLDVNIVIFFTVKYITYIYFFYIFFRWISLTCLSIKNSE